MEDAVYQRCIAWIVRSAGRDEFDQADLDEAVRKAADDPSAAAHAENIRAAGTSWLRARAPEARAPRCLPEPAWTERVRTQLATRPEIRAAYLVELFAPGEEPRHVVWVDLADGTLAPAQVVAEVAARVPTCYLDDRLLKLRAADGTAIDEQARSVGEPLYTRVAPARIRTPRIEQSERAEGTLSKRYTLEIEIEIDGTIPTADCVRALERRIATWRQQRAAKAKGIVLDVVVPPQLRAQVSREVEAATAAWEMKPRIELHDP